MPNPLLLGLLFFTVIPFQATGTNQLLEIERESLRTVTEIRLEFRPAAANADLWSQCSVSVEELKLSVSRPLADARIGVVPQEAVRDALRLYVDVRLFRTVSGTCSASVTLTARALAQTGNFTHLPKPLPAPITVDVLVWQIATGVTGPPLDFGTPVYAQIREFTGVFVAKVKLANAK